MATASQCLLGQTSSSLTSTVFLPSSDYRYGSLQPPIVEFHGRSCTLPRAVYAQESKVTVTVPHVHGLLEGTSISIGTEDQRQCLNSCWESYKLQHNSAFHSTISAGVSCILVLKLPVLKACGWRGRFCWRLKYHTETPCRHTCCESESQICQWLIASQSINQSYCRPIAAKINPRKPKSFHTAAGGTVCGKIIDEQIVV
jgi:hypothetical protein